MPFEDEHNGSTAAESSSSAVSLEEVIEKYLEELARGKTPDREACLKAHPSLATALKGVFKTLDFVEKTSRSFNGAKLEAGQRLGEYRIVREVARGGMGVVYEAVQASLDRRVALKVLPFGALLSETAAERFAREAATAGRLHHTNIVPIYAVGEERGIHYYAMQYIEGSSLSEHLKMLRDRGKPTGREHFERVARWSRQVAEALAYAHREGIIHRDIKPSNLLLDSRDNIWITDFGLARAESHATITMTGDVIGTARYMSPEQARGGKGRLDERTDIYSLGVTLYELLALMPAFDGDSREAVLNRVAMAQAAPLRKVVRAIPKDLETIVAKCMEKEPVQRYRSAQELAEDCRRFCAGESILARRTPLAVKAARFFKRYRLRVMGVLLVLALAIAMVVLAVKVRRTRGQSRLDEAFDIVLVEGDSKRASRLLDEAESLGIGSAELYLCRGLVPLWNGRPHDAMAFLSEALKRDPANVEACLAMALACNMTTDFVEGRRFFERVAGREITTSLGWLLHGHALSSFQGSTAIESFNRAIELKPDFVPAILARSYYRANRLLNLGDRAELEPMLDDSDAFVVCRPNLSGSYAYRARNWLYAAAYAGTQPEMKRSREEWLANCRSDLDTALALRGGGNSFPLFIEGIYFFDIGDFHGAAESLAEAIAVNRAASRSVDFTLIFKRVIALYALGEVKKALEEVEAIRDPMPGYYPLSLIRSFLLAEAGRLDEARKVCRSNMKKYGENATAFFLFAVGMELLGDREASRSAAEEFAARDARRIVFEDASQAAHGPATKYLLGRLSAGELLSAAERHPGRCCEFAFYVGLRELGRWNREAGLAALEKCIGTGVVIFGEYDLAQGLLARAETDPGWPRWLKPKVPESPAPDK